MISVRIEGIPELLAKLKTLADYTSDGIAETLDESAEKVIYPIFKEKFDDEGKTKYSNRWIEWTDWTKERRELRLGYYGRVNFAGANKILQWSGRLKESITGKTEAIKEISKISEGIQMTLGTEVEYASVLQEGELRGGDKGGNLPARPIYEPKDFQTELVDYIREQIVKIL